MSSRRRLPYKGLARYEEEDKDLFAGRDMETDECTRLILGSATAVFILHGLSGCGKSSFIRAGLIPHLRSRATEANAIVPLAVFGPFDMSFPTHGPLHALAGAVYDAAHYLASEAPSPTKLDRSIGKEKSAFASELAYDASGLYEAMSQLAVMTPLIPVFFLDHVERILDTSVRREVQEPFYELMSRLCSRRIDLRICAIMRSEYKARFEDEVYGARALAIAGYCLPEIEDHQLKCAIVKPSEDPTYGYGFDSNVVEEVIKRATQGAFVGDNTHRRGVIGGRLVATQLMCDRLYRYATNEHRPEALRGRIRLEDVYALGHPNEQFILHVQESLYEAFDEGSAGDSRKASKERKANRADLWLERLSALVESAPDGRARSLSLRFEAIAPSSETESAARRVVAHLCDPNEYVLREEEDGTLRLCHDSLALALRLWAETHRLHGRPRIGRSHGVLLAAEHGQRGFERLWLPKYFPRPESLYLTTLRDGIWDHLLLDYARYKGFTRRLGIRLSSRGFEVDRPGQPTDRLYERFYGQVGQRIGIIPVELQPIPEGWRGLAVTNIFNGYCITGREPLPNGRDAVVQAFDNYCLKFATDLVKIMKWQGERCPTVKPFVPADPTSQPDEFYQWLLHTEHAFAIGPAPTRARWRQTGLFSEWSVMSEEQAQALHARQAMRRRLQQLAMHEICVVYGVEDPKWIRRLASVVFFTVQFILAAPWDFVRFLFDYEYDARRGRIPVSREAIHTTIQASYRYSPFGAYAQDYLNPGSLEFLHDEPCRLQIKTVYKELIDLRKEYDDTLLLIMERGVAEDDRLTREILATAARHYRIYNFGDARDLVRIAAERIGANAGR